MSENLSVVFSHTKTGDLETKNIANGEILDIECLRMSNKQMQELESHLNTLYKYILWEDTKHCDITLEEAKNSLQMLLDTFETIKNCNKHLTFEHDYSMFEEVEN